ncbi:hypothetical protein HGRIS_007061 [Hohenbuehelia grisea]|uniref:Alpha/beta hydrolase fold-3 domain-containing protein n=1 Tax=Hohenbuehelia grisea TaxID=104357 RepID=A0ABR3JBB0_9AGAR
MPTKPARYAQLSARETATLPFILLGIPFVLAGTLFALPFSNKPKEKHWRRVLTERILRYVSSISMSQTQKLTGTTESVYRKAVVKLRVKPVVEDLGHGAELFWLGPKRNDRILLYVHGGAFYAPPMEPALYCLDHVRKKLEARTNSLDVGVAILKYSLWPEAAFPTPLHQAVLAIQHLLASGVHPSGLQLIGDSAGANLITQVLLHTLIPLDGVPPLKLTAPLGGVFLISPWASLSAKSPSHTRNNGSDWIAAESIRYWGAAILADVPTPLRGYIEAVDAPDAWFDGLERVVRRVFITAGGAECLLDDIVQFADIVKKHHSRVDFLIEEGGVHDDMIVDFVSGLPEEQLSETSSICVQWLAEGFDEAK